MAECKIFHKSIFSQNKRNLTIQFQTKLGFCKYDYSYKYTKLKGWHYYLTLPIFNSTKGWYSIDQPPHVQHGHHIAVNSISNSNS